MDHKLVSGIVNSLPIDKMVAAPLMAAADAQKSLCKGMAEFINEVALDSKTGEIRTVSFRYKDYSTADNNGVERSIEAPFVTLTGIPALSIETVDVNFDLTVSTAEQDKSSKDISATASAGAKFGGFQASFSGSVATKSEQTRSSDTRARYSFNVTARKQETPEALMRIIDFLTDAQITPKEEAKNMTPGGSEAA